MRKRLWIPLTIVLLVPVPVVFLSHQPVSGSGMNGELFTGSAALDSILSEASGKPVILNFWATWCGPCVRELPELEVLAADLGDRAVVIAVDIGDPDLSTLISFRENNPIDLNVVWLDGADAELAAERYSLEDVLPVSVILDGSGDETARAIGARSTEWFASAVEGASSGLVAEPLEQVDIHVYVVGLSDDPLVGELAEAALQIAGPEGFDVLDPSLTGDSILMEEAYLPMSGWPYAQLCVWGACRPPVDSAATLLEAFNSMR